MENQNNREIVLTRIFDAPREFVWKAWTDASKIVKWWGPAGFTNTLIKMDVRSGGIWEHVMHGPDGTDYPNLVTFDEVIEPERLAFTHQESKEFGLQSFKSIVIFEDMGEKTKITLTSIFVSPEEKEKQIKEVGAIEGGKQTLQRLADFLKDNT